MSNFPDAYPLARKCSSPSMLSRETSEDFCCTRQSLLILQTSVNLTLLFAEMKTL